MKESEISDRSEMTTVRTKLIYGFGSVAFGVKDQGFSYFLLFFYNQVIGLPALVVGSAIAIALAADAFIDPIIGEISDKLRTRWGRRHPLMYASAVPLAIAYWFLWSPPVASQQEQFFYLVAMAILIRTLISLYEVPSAALLAELTFDYDQRTAMLGYRYFFSWIGGLSMTILGFGLFFKPSVKFPQGQLDPANYPSYATAACVIMVVAIIASSLGTHRFIPLLSSPPEHRKQSVKQVLSEMLESVKNRSFIFITLSSFFNFGAAGVATNMNFYLSTFFWNLTAHNIFILTVALLPAPLVAMFLAPYLGKRFGKRRATIGLWLVSLITNWSPLTLRLLGLFPSNYSPYLVPALLSFSLFGSIFAAANSIVMSSMLADIVEDSQLKTGRRSEGLFFSANSFVQKAVSGLGGFASGMILAIAHFPANAKPGDITSELASRMAWIYMSVVLCLYILSMVTIAFYSITRQSHEQAVAALKLNGRPQS